MDRFTCEVVWDGVDFSACFKDRYLANWPLLIVLTSLITLFCTRLLPKIQARLHRKVPKLSPKTLISPTSDSDLAKLESDVILSSLAINLLPASKDEEKSNISGVEGGKVIEQWKLKTAGRKDIKRWKRFGAGVGTTGAAVWMGVECWRALGEGGWKGVVFPMWIFVLSILPRSPIIPLISLHLLPSLLILRGQMLHSRPTLLGLAPNIIELVYWVLLVSIPYGEGLDRLLDGARSKGGGTSGTYGKEIPKHLEEPTSAFSRATYYFMLPLLFRHYAKPITLEEIPQIREDDTAAAGIGAFRAYQAAKDVKYAKKHDGAKRERNLGFDLLGHYSPEIFMQAIWATVFIFLQYLPPTGLRLLLKYVSDRQTNEQPLHVAFLYVGMMAAGQCIGVTAMGQSLVIGRRLCIRLRATIISEVFTKALRRQDIAGSVKKDASKSASDQPAEAATEGKIANLVSVDAFQISEICAYVFYLWSCPLAVVINSFLLYNTLGLAGLAGIAVLVALIPVQTLVGRLFTIIQRRFMAATDARLDAVTEVIAHIKLIKFNAWESKFFDRMAETRKTELAVLSQRFAVAVLQNLVIWGTPVLVTASAFAVHSLWLKQPLTADRAFASLILFNMLRDPLALFGDTLTRLLQAYTSCTRIQAFLEEPDTLKYRQVSRPGPSDPQVGFKGAVVGYAKSCDGNVEEGQSEPFTLGKLDLTFPAGGLSVITGPVGCGKSTLILALLGEVHLLEGKIFMPDDHANRDVCPIDKATGLSDTVAYCAQTPWLVGASIRENITFGTPFDKARYNAVVDACALRRDFEIFELGDETEVGEKGTTCSGGQKARIALARAVYSSAKTVILDDVLSAVDAQTARHLHVHVLMGKLMRGRTCILVSHAVNLVVPSASLVVMLEDGKVTASGTPSELSSSGALTLHEDEGDHSDSDQAQSSSTLTPDTPLDIIEENLDGIEGDALETAKLVDADKANPEALKLAKQLVAAESQSTGSIGLKTYLLYFKSMGGSFYWVVVATMFFGSQALQVDTNAWVKDWASSNDRLSQRIVAFAKGGNDQGERSTKFYIAVYLAISGLYLVFVAGRVAVNYNGSLRASRALYGRLLKRILGARMRFFDSTPSGRIMNRLSKDMSSTDNETAEICQYFAQCLLSCIAVLAVVTFSTPKFLFALVIIGVLYWLVGSLYVSTSREIKRFDSVTRSPLFISFSEVLVGMSTIRSYGDSARFMRKLFQELDQNTRCFWYLWQANRVLNNFSNFVGSLVTITACVFALSTPGMDAGAVGFSITYALSFTEFVLWVVRLYAAAEMSMNSVERIAEYLDLEVEEEDNEKGIEPPAYWPSREGSVVVENLTCHYAPQLDPVLRDVSFTIQPREKIGICGRTGSGKSTLALSFFRFLHQSGGSITIDGLDISKLSLAALRSRLTILPQEAQLFSGTIRDNLDPFGAHEDYEVWDALRQVGLSSKTPGASKANSRAASSIDLKAHAQKVEAQNLRKQILKKTQDEARNPTAIVKDAKDEDDDDEVEERVVIRSLDEKVAVGGKNFSQGQRQLLALARGLLKLQTSSFLIMDESTANLDHATDMTIQNVLRTGLADTQMLVIAHRLMTVCGLDRILVLDQGKVVEYGTPWELMQKEDGTFRDLCRQSGEESQLIEMAKSVHEAKEAGI